MTVPLLEVRDLVKHYRAHGTVIRAVDGVSLDIAAGETLGLVGESGSGKSTVGRTVLRLEPLTSGSVRFDGNDLGSLSSAALRATRRRMQLVFQDPGGALNPRRRVGDAIAEGMRIHRTVAPGATA